MLHERMLLSTVRPRLTVAPETPLARRSVIQRRMVGPSICANVRPSKERRRTATRLPKVRLSRAIDSARYRAATTSKRGAATGRRKMG